MKKKLQKILSVLLVVVLLTNCWSVGVLASSEEVSSQSENASVQTEDLQVSGEGSVGTMIAEALSENMPVEDETCYITDIIVEDTVAVVTYQTDMASDLVVAIYDEETGQMLASATTPVEKEESKAIVEFEVDEMPEYFLATAYLMNQENHYALCEEYTTEMYTQRMEEFLAKNINDFDEDRILNLDESEDTNFGVYKSDTYVVKEDAETNQITDHGDGTYTIVNANEVFMGLVVGDIVSYEYNDGSVLVVKIKEIEINDGTVFITEDTDIDLEDVFDYVKIESGNQLDNGASFLASGNVTKSVTKDIEVVNKKFESDDKDKNVIVSLKGELTAKAEVNLYIEKEWQYIEVKIGVYVKATGSVSGSLKCQFPLLNDMIGLSPVPGVYVEFEPSIILQVSGEITLGIAFSTVVGFAWDSEKGALNKTTGPQMEDIEPFKVSVVVYLGLSLEPSVVILHEKIAKASLTAEAGAELTAKLESSFIEDENIVHECTACVTGTINGKINVSASIKFVDSDLLQASLKIISKTYKLTDFYYSFDHNKFGWTTCPYIAYKVIITAQDEKGNLINGAAVGGTNLSDVPFTDENGKAAFYLPNGNYTLKVTYGTLLGIKKFAIENNVKNISLVLKNENITDDGLTYVIKDGVVTITGYAGDETELEIPETIEGYTVTQIGERAFTDCVSLTKISFPKTLTRINDFAFWGCSGLKGDLVLPEGLEYIGTYAFKGCYGLSGDLCIPDTVTTIQPEAFMGCSGFNGTLILSKNLTVIKSRVFSGCSGLTGSFGVEGRLVIPDTVTIIEGSAFEYCNNFTQVVVGAGITKLYTTAFGSKVKDVYFTSETPPSIVTAVTGEYIYHFFNKYTSFETIWVPEGCYSTYVSKWGTWIRTTTRVKEDSDEVYIVDGNVLVAYQGNASEVEIPDGIVEIGNGAFLNYAGLEKVVIPENVTRIGNYAFKNAGLSGELTLPNGLTKIGKYAFYNCANLTGTLYLPESITEIGEYAFYGCTGFTGDLVLPDGVVTINPYTFCGCTGFDGGLVLPSNLQIIDESAFESCKKSAEH